MIDFFRDLSVNPFLGAGLLAGLLASLACGIIGPYVVTRRIVFLSGAIAHIAIGGVGAAIFLRYRFDPALDWLDPLYGAAAAALLAALLIGAVQHFAGERLDTLIGAFWAVGMAAGVVLIAYTPGYQVELFSYLFGNISFVSWGDVALIALLDLVILLMALLFHKRLVAVCLDEEYARLQGIGVLTTNLVLLGLVALTVVTLVRVVGLILVLALLTLPAATAGHYTRRLGAMMLASTLLCAFLTTLPRAAVYGTRVPPEAAIVLCAGAVYLLSVLWRWLHVRARLRAMAR